MLIRYQMERGQRWAVGSTDDGRHQLHQTTGGDDPDDVLPGPLLIVDRAILYAGSRGDPIPVCGLLTLLRVSGLYP